VGLMDRELIIKTPSKIILFGEHAVVDGYGAISMAIDLKTTGKISFNDTVGNKIIINLKNLNKNISIDVGELPHININDYENDLKYVVCSLKNTVNYLIGRNLINLNNLNNLKSFELDISSDIPVSCGLGSSASVIITVIKSFLIANNIHLADDEISKIAHSVEKDVQGRASITDTATITYGGILKIKDNKIESIKNSKLYNILKSCNFLIVHAELRKRKTAELVNDVAKHPKKDEIFKSIGDIVENLESINGKEELGKLMVQNHELLRELGVSTEKLDKVVEIGKKYGYGAKLSGAGGGGVAIILVDENKKEMLLKKLDDLEILSVFECKMA
jgi:mevalonate kinase